MTRPGSWHCPKHAQTHLGIQEEVFFEVLKWAKNQVIDELACNQCFWLQKISTISNI